jgi:chromatin structure-remodeling complex protein RSC7
VKGQPYNTNKYVAWHGASSVYHSAKYMSTPNPSTTAPKPSVGKQNVVDRDDPNWMLEQCKAERYEATRPSSFRRQLTPSQPCQSQAYPDASQRKERRVRRAHEHDALSGQHAANTNTGEMGASPGTADGSTQRARA